MIVLPKLYFKYIFIGCVHLELKLSSLPVLGLSFIAMTATCFLFLYWEGYPYALAIALYAICLFNDSVVPQHRRTLFPTTWIPEV